MHGKGGATMTRAEINAKIAEKREQVRAINSEITALQKEALMLCDEEQWYKEEDEVFTISKRPKKTETKRVGRIYWLQNFIDESNGNILPIERSEIVKINGEWQ